MDFVTAILQDILHITIRDLLAHRSGLGACEGDLMLFPSPNDFTTKDIIHSLQFLKPAFDFRTKFSYSNLLYAVAGEIIDRVSGKSNRQIRHSGEIDGIVSQVTMIPEFNLGIIILTNQEEPWRRAGSSLKPMKILAVAAARH